MVCVYFRGFLFRVYRISLWVNFRFPAHPHWLCSRSPYSLSELWGSLTQHCTRGNALELAAHIDPNPEQLKYTFSLWTPLSTSFCRGSLHNGRYSDGDAAATYLLGKSRNFKQQTNINGHFCASSDGHLTKTPCYRLHWILSTIWACISCRANFLLLYPGTLYIIKQFSQKK